MIQKVKVNQKNKINKKMIIYREMIRMDLGNQAEVVVDNNKIQKLKV